MNILKKLICMCTILTTPLIVFGQGGWDIYNQTNTAIAVLTDKQTWPEYMQVADPTGLAVVGFPFNKVYQIQEVTVCFYSEHVGTCATDYVPVNIWGAHTGTPGSLVVTGHCDLDDSNPFNVYCKNLNGPFPVFTPGKWDAKPKGAASKPKS